MLKVTSGASSIPCWGASLVAGGDSRPTSSRESVSRPSVRTLDCGVCCERGGDPLPSPLAPLLANGVADVELNE
jgi:hypothetical protein